MPAISYDAKEIMPDASSNDAKEPLPTVDNTVDEIEKSINHVVDRAVSDPPPPPVDVFEPQPVQNIPTPPVVSQGEGLRRSQRIRQPNKNLDPDVWDLGSISTEMLPLMAMLEIVKNVVEKVESQMRICLSRGGR